MDSLTQIALTRALVDIDSTTGREAEAGEWLASTLEARGWTVERQPVGDRRFNVFARTDAPPVVVLSTHYDCVPPFVPSREMDGRVYGRGACDAKGALVAQMAAAERLRDAGERRIALLFVVGEERGSEGARTANGLAPAGVQYLVNGEPTDNRLASATRGIYRVRLRATGRAAHSSLPHLGVSAIDKLLDALMAIRAIDWPRDPELGETFYSVGLVGGGVAPNVIPPAAEAELMFRTIGEPGPLRRAIERVAGTLVSVDDILVVPPVRLKTLPGFDTAAFAFTTDVPWLDRWGTPLLLGPGSATLAHTDEEHCAIVELTRAATLYETLVRRLLV